MKRRAAIRIRAGLNPSAAELADRARYRSWLAKQMRADRIIEDHFAERVARNVADRLAASTSEFVNRRQPLPSAG